MKNQEQKILTISGLFTFKNTALCLLGIKIIVIVAVGTMGYYNFCRFDLIDESEMGTPSCYPYCVFNDIERIDIYKDMIYLHKGMTLCAADSNSVKASVRLGWDGSIYIKKRKIEKRLIVKKNYPAYWSNMVVDNGGDRGRIGIIVKEATMESECVSFKDDKGNSVIIYKQPNDLPYGHKKYGFFFEVDDMEFMSGKRDNPFDY